MEEKKIKADWKIYYGSSHFPVVKMVSQLEKISSSWNENILTQYFLEIRRLNGDNGVPFYTFPILKLDIKKGNYVSSKLNQNDFRSVDIIKKKSTNVLMTTFPPLHGKLSKIIQFILNRRVQIAGIYRRKLIEQLDEWYQNPGVDPLELKENQVDEILLKRIAQTDKSFIQLIGDLYKIMGTSKSYQDFPYNKMVDGYSLKYWIMGAGLPPKEYKLQTKNKQERLITAPRKEKFGDQLGSDPTFDNELNDLINTIGIGGYGVCLNEEGRYVRSNHLAENSIELSEELFAEIDNFLPDLVSRTSRLQL